MPTFPVFRQRFISQFENCICTRMYRLVCRFLSRFRQTVQRADACRPTRSGLRVPTLDRVDSLLAVRCSVGSQLPALRDQLATAREGMEHCSKRLQANGDHGGG
jgi:hypothetical protein